MGHLDEAAFARALGPCVGCASTVHQLDSYLDRAFSMMLGDPNDEGRWIHDGEKFIDGTFRIACLACQQVGFEHTDCPRCHHPGALPGALAASSRLEVPRRCPSCNQLELTITGFAPATVKAGLGRTPTPTPRALVGEPGFHVAVIACDACEWVAVFDGCAICGAPGPLRARP